VSCTIINIEIVEMLTYIRLLANYKFYNTIFKDYFAFVHGKIDERRKLRLTDDDVSIYVGW